MLGLFLLGEILTPSGLNGIRSISIMSTTTRKKKERSFPRDVGKGVAKGLGKLASGAATGVVSELASILTLGLFRPRKRRR
jgi:hypothetical protein